MNGIFLSVHVALSIKGEVYYCLHKIDAIDLPQNVMIVVYLNELHLVDEQVHPGEDER